MTLSKERKDRLYLSHRERVENASAKVDTGSPMYNARMCMRRLRDDTIAFNRIADDNLALLELLNGIMRASGYVDSFRDKSPPSHSRTSEFEARSIQMEQENRQMGERIMAAKTVVDTWHSKKALSHAKWHTRTQRPRVFIFPDKIMSKYKDVNVPRNTIQLKQLFRPVIYLNLGVKNLRPLGRLTITLYTEASPQVVMEFIRFASAGKPEKLIFKRLFRRLWLEGELELSENSMMKKRLEYDMRALDHGRHVGILSYSLKNVMRQTSLSFTISFKPLRVLNGRRVAFGVITYGENMLDIIQDYGTKNGKPIRQIVCNECGIDKKRY